MLPEDSTHPGFASVTLKGHAIDHDGSDITGTNLVWKISGSEVGRGNTVDVQIKLDSGTFLDYYKQYLHPIWLEARGKQGDQETAAISVYTQIPVIIP
jgi:hypothetical protein